MCASLSADRSRFIRNAFTSHPNLSAPESGASFAVLRMRIRLSYYFANDPLIRQTPGGSGVWKGHRFTANDSECRDCDIWVVLEDLVEERETAFVKSGLAVLIMMEPPGIREYPSGFLAQFDLVVSSHRDLPHPNVRNEYQGLPWHIGIPRATDAAGEPRHATSYDDLLRLTPPRKTAALSVISSSKSRLKGHRLRQGFVEKLQARLGDRVDVFGRGIRPIHDKSDAIIPYRYHLVLENSRLPDYWTEKLADSYLGWAFPIYWGCSNIADYFGPDSLVEIDIERPDEAIARIEAVMGLELTPKQLSGLSAARALVLDRYNTFDVIRRTCKSLPPASPREIAIRSQSHFRPSGIRRNANRLLAKSLRAFS
jgi:hypothetical protein